jgi:hypothetical protein
MAGDRRQRFRKRARMLAHLDLVDHYGVERCAEMGQGGAERFAVLHVAAN